MLPTQSLLPVLWAEPALEELGGESGTLTPVHQSAGASGCIELLDELQRQRSELKESQQAAAAVCAMWELTEQRRCDSCV